MGKAQNNSDDCGGTWNENRHGLAFGFEPVITINHMKGDERYAVSHHHQNLNKIYHLCSRIFRNIGWGKEDEMTDNNESFHFGGIHFKAPIGVNGATRSPHVYTTSGVLGDHQGPRSWVPTIDSASSTNIVQLMI